MMGAGTNKWHQDLIEVGGLFRAGKLKEKFIVTKQITYNRPLKISSSLYSQTYIFSLVVTIDQKRKQCHPFFKALCDLKASNCGKCLIFFVTVLFIREEWICLNTLLKTGLLMQISSEKLLQISKTTFQH